MSNPIIRTDDTDAFGGHFGKITIHNPDLIEISKIEVVTNSGTCIKNKRYTDDNDFKRDEIVLMIDYSSDETKRLNQGANTLNIVLYDKHNKQKTCLKTLTFYAQNGVIQKNGKCGC